MTNSLQRWRQWRTAMEPAIVVTIDATRGSVPRPAGTRMLVTHHDVIGTIGGGHLEFTAIDVARRQLGDASRLQQRRFVLGASLGQCCGGVATVNFETISPADIAAADEIGRWFIESIAPPAFPVVLFGAGHVGTALASVLGHVPCSVTWVDSRDDAFPSNVGDNVRTIVTDAPEAEVDAAPRAASFVVMTHSHALDEALTAAILTRNEFAYLGLIGSISKRRMFERRLANRGIDPARFDRLTCPIGIDGIAGKEPGVIAVAVAAELLRERARWVGSANVANGANAAHGSATRNR